MSDLRKSMAASRPSVFLPTAAAGRPSVFLSNNAGGRPSVFLGSTSGPGPGSGTGSSASSGSGPSGASAAAGGSFGFGSSAASEKRYASKELELRGLLMLEAQTTKLVAEIQSLDDRVGGIVDGSKTFASVLSSWEGVFRAIQISRADLAMLSAETAGMMMNNYDPDEKQDHPGAVAEKENSGGGSGGGAALDARAQQPPEQEDPLATLDEDRVRVHTLVRIPVDDEGAVVAHADEEEEAAKPAPTV